MIEFFMTAMVGFGTNEKPIPESVLRSLNPQNCAAIIEMYGGPQAQYSWKLFPETPWHECKGRKPNDRVITLFGWPR